MVLERSWGSLYVTLTRLLWSWSPAAQCLIHLIYIITWVLARMLWFCHSRYYHGKWVSIWQAGSPFYTDQAAVILEVVAPLSRSFHAPPTPSTKTHAKDSPLICCVSLLSGYVIKQFPESNIRRIRNEIAHKCLKFGEHKERKELQGMFQYK